jgi:hypothetical protein
MVRVHTLYPHPYAKKRTKAGVPGKRKEPSKEVLSTLRLADNRVVVVGLIGGSIHGKANLLGILADTALPQVSSLYYLFFDISYNINFITVTLPGVRPARGKGQHPQCPTG